MTIQDSKYKKMLVVFLLMGAVYTVYKANIINQGVKNTVQPFVRGRLLYLTLIKRGVTLKRGCNYSVNALSGPQTVCLRS